MTHSSRSKLHTVLRANAGFSALGGIVALLAAPWLAEQSGIDHVIITRLLGVGLLLFAVDVLVVSRSDGRRLIRDSLLVSIADFSWVAATAIVVIAVDLTTAGIVGAVLIALAVADFGTMQLWFRSKLVGSKGAAIVTA